MSRPLRERLGEAIRRSRIGNTIPWDNLDDAQRATFTVSADEIILSLGKELGFSIKDDAR